MKKIIIIIGTLINLFINTTAFAQANEPGAGNCLSYNGVSNYVDITNMPIGNVSTISFWINPSNFGVGFGNIILKFAGPNDEAIYHDASGSPTSGIGYKAGLWSLGFNTGCGSMINIGEWTHISLVRNGLNVKYYKNGELKCDNNFSSGAPISTVLSIAQQGSYGGPPGGRNYFNGSLDEVRIWNYARSITEIQEDMCQKLSGSETGLVGYWRFDEGSGSTAFDSSPNNNDGTLQ